MHLVLDQLAWGNPSAQDVNNMQVTSFLDEILPALYKQAPYLNSSRATQDELKQLMSYAELREYSARRHIFDGELVPYIKDLFIRNGCDAERVNQVADSIVVDVLPIITKLKYHFQRPRPAQLAYYFKLPFFPNFSRYVSSPSYPSGHSVLGAVLTEVLSAEYSAVFPNCYEVMRKFCGEILESRLYMGVHYPSDNRFALHVAQQIINVPAFHEKYDF